MTGCDSQPSTEDAEQSRTTEHTHPAEPAAFRLPASGLGETSRPLDEVFDLALLDLDGVVYLGPQAVQGAVPALLEAKEAGMRLAYVTNNAARPPQAVAAHLQELGIPADVEEVVTSAQIAASLLARRLPPGSGVLVVGGEGLRQALHAEGLKPVDSLEEGPQAVVQGFSPDLQWLDLALGADAVRSGLFWMATNLDLTVPRASGAAPGNGTLVAAVRTAAGRGPDQVAGKPDPAPFLETVRRMGSECPLVVGDRLDTDLEGAMAANMPSLLVLTGVTGAGDLLACPAHQRPTFLGADLGALMTPHPAVTVQALADLDVDSDKGDRPRDGFAGSCRVSRVLVGTCPDGVARAQVDQPGEDPLDVLRAACCAVWAWTDRVRTGSRSRKRLDTSEIFTVLDRQTSGASWTR